MRRELNAEDAACAVWGGSVLACGGGGWVSHGELMGPLATSIGRPVLASVDELADDDVVVTVTAIGAPAAAGWEIRPLDYVRALQMIAKRLDRPVAGVMTAQNGSSTTLNGWIQSAVLGVPVLDVAGDVRAHPTGKLGALGVGNRPHYEALQAVAGGNRAQNGYLEVLVRGAPFTADNVLRDVCVRAGGFIASARNPIEAAWVKAHGALGAISYALRLGAAMRAATDAEATPGAGQAVIEAIVETTGGRIVTTGPVSVARPMRTAGGFDHGAFRVGEVTAPFLNEYMALEAGGTRVATYPDVIATLSLDTGRPVSIAELAAGVAEGGSPEVAVFACDRSQLILSSSTTDQGALEEVEEIMGISLR